MAIQEAIRDGNHVPSLLADNQSSETIRLYADPTTHELLVKATLSAVELKNGTTDARAVINAANTVRAATDNVLLVQTIDASGNVGAGTPSIPPYTHSSARGNFTAAYASNVTLTITGAPATVTNNQIVAIIVNTSAGTSARMYVNGVAGISMSISSTTITITGAGTPFAVSDTYDVLLNLFETGYDMTIDSDKAIIQNPRTALSESIVDTTNVAAATNYYPSATGKEFGNREDLSFTGKMVDADGTMTLSLQGTNDEDTTNADWQDVYFYDAINKAVVNTITITNGTVYINGHADKFNMVYYRYKMVNGGATNTMIIKERIW